MRLCGVLGLRDSKIIPEACRGRTLPSQMHIHVHCDLPCHPWQGIAGFEWDD